MQQNDSPLNTANDELLAEIEATPAKAPPNVAEIQAKAKELRDLLLKKEEIEAQLRDVKIQIFNVQSKELVDMFNLAGVSSISVDADGNHPGFVASRGTMYSAKIPDDKRKEALAWFENNGHGDLVKAVVSVQFGMQEHERRLLLRDVLTKAGFEFRSDEEVHHMTLKAFVRREIEKGHIVPRELLGVSVWDEVKIKEN